MNGSVGSAILDLASGRRLRSICVVGTGKNAGKTVTARTIALAALRKGLRVGITSLGRDGEIVDAVDARLKPRLYLPEGVRIACARDVLPAHPACEILEKTSWQTAAGPVIIARVRHLGFFEVAGPATSSGARACIARFFELGCEIVVVDGAVDRVAALAGGEDAVVIASGADGAKTMDEAVEEARALAVRLGTPPFDSQEPFIEVDGALLPSLAAELMAAGERRQVVVTDPTQIALHGKAMIAIADRLKLRCRRSLHVVAATVASVGRDRCFEPRTFLRRVGRAANLPVFDVYANAAA